MSLPFCNLSTEAATTVGLGVCLGWLRMRALLRLSVAIAIISLLRQFAATLNSCKEHTTSHAVRYGILQSGCTGENGAACVGHGILLVVMVPSFKN